MSFKKQEVNNYLLYDTPVENIFISEYAKNASGDDIKVYLLALMYANLGKEFDNVQLSKALNLDAEKVNAAWDYWQECGIVNKKYLDSSNPDNYEVKFLNIKELFLGGGNSTSKKASSKITDNKMGELFKTIEKETGRSIGSREAKDIISYIKDHGMDMDSILIAYQVAIKNGVAKADYNYVARILENWAKEGLKTKEKVLAYLEDTNTRNRFYKEVLKLLGFIRNATQAEKKIMDKWVDKFGCTIEDVEKACQIATGVSNPNLKYLDSVIASQMAKDAENTAADRERVLSSVDNIYEKIAETNRKKTENNRKKVYEKIPGLRNIMEEYKANTKELTTLLLTDDKERSEKLQKRQKYLQNQIKQLLTEAGFPENILDPVYSCTKCKDTGYLEDGSRCSCFNERLKEVQK